MPPISERALREAFGPRRSPDYFGVAVAITRARFTPALSHWNTYDAPIDGGRQQTACGEYAPLASFSPEPTCPACRQQQALYDAAEF